MISYSLIGLGIIVVAWLVQFFLISKKSKKINPYFVGLYALGVAVLVYDGFSSGLKNLAIANLVSLVVSVLVLVRVLRK
jgi:uncharacterized membrane protein (DUF373 family)